MWLHQLQTSRTIGDADLEQRVHERIGRLGRQEVGSRQYQLEDEDRSLARRLEAKHGLELLFRHQVLVMKHYIDHAEQERFIDAWRQWVDWAKHWTPENDVDDLEFQAMHAVGGEQLQAERELESARLLLKAKRELEARRASLTFALGTWALDLHQHDELAAPEWLALMPYLAGMAAPDLVWAVRLLRSIYTDVEIEEVERWQLGAWDRAPGWQPADTWLLARLWGTLLALRAIPLGGSAPEIELGADAAWLESEILDELARIGNEPEKWEGVVGDRVADRVAVAREAVERAVKLEAERAKQRLAEAPLDADKLAAFAELQRRVYADGDYLRQRLLVAGAVTREKDSNAFSQASGARIMPKRPFTAIEGSDVLIAEQQPAKELVIEQLHETYVALVELAPLADGGDPEAASQAVQRLREAGHEPDCVLVPQDVYVRNYLAGHPAWTWERDPSSKHFARLGGVPVYDAGPRDADALIVCELAASIRRVERHRPSDGSPIRVDVDLIDDQRANELVTAGYRAPGVDAEDLEAQREDLRGAWVEVHVDMDVRWLATPDGAIAAVRIALPSPQERRVRRRKE